MSFSLKKKVLPRVLGVIAGASFGLYLMTTTVVTEPGYESVLQIQPPFLPAVYTGDVDQPGKHYHLQFTTGIPVKAIQSFTEVEAQLFTRDYKDVKADIIVTLKVKDAAKLLHEHGEDWYKQQVGMAVQGAAGLAGMGFTESDLIEHANGNFSRFDTVGSFKLQGFMISKDIPVIVQDFKIVRTYH